MFKIGDRVKVIKDIWDKNLLNKIGTVIDKGDLYSTIEFDIFINGHEGNGSGKKGHCWNLNENEIELVKNKIPELKERYLVKYRNGQEGMIDKFDRIEEIKNGKFTNECITDLDELDENLLYNFKNMNKYDIMEVYKPQYEKIWERQEEVKSEVKEMTMKEICDKLGYEIKIKKEEK